jgi:hypothetical protein
MNNSLSVRELALSILNKKWDSAWDSRGTAAKNLSQGEKPAGTVKNESDHELNPTVPLSHALGTGTLGQSQKTGTPLGTLVGQSGAFPYAEALDDLERRIPDYVEPGRWQQCLDDTQRFIADWGAQAEALGWTADELLGLHEPPANPHLSYSRLSRYDATGLIWGLCGRRVIALTEDTAAVETSSGALIYRKHRKPAFGPLGDSLDDFIP